MLDIIKRLKEEIGALTASDLNELESLRIKYLSKKGEITSLFNEFRNVPAEQKREVGKLLNELKDEALQKINSLKERISDNKQTDTEIDLTRSAYPVKLGTRHPISIVKNEICDIFGKLGFSIAEGPEIEDDWHVFS